MKTLHSWYRLWFHRFSYQPHRPPLVHGPDGQLPSSAARSSSSIYRLRVSRLVTAFCLRQRDKKPRRRHCMEMAGAAWPAGRVWRHRSPDTAPRRTVVDHDFDYGKRTVRDGRGDRDVLLTGEPLHLFWENLWWESSSIRKCSVITSETFTK